MADERSDRAASRRAAAEEEGPEGIRSLGDDLQFFDEGAPGSLAHQRDLIDAEGDDIREYTGEPVETADGWVIPHQQNVGPGNMAGDGEFPDPDTPPVQPVVDESGESGDPGDGGGVRG